MLSVREQCVGCVAVAPAWSDAYSSAPFPSAKGLRLLVPSSSRIFSLRWHSEQRELRTHRFKSVHGVLLPQLSCVATAFNCHDQSLHQ